LEALVKIVAIMPVRNEAWCLGFTARALLRWVDHLVILDHASTDATKSIVNDIALEHVGRVRLLEDSNPVWQEMRHRQRLLTEARALGATHIALVDADEVLSANALGDIRDMFESVKPGEVLALPWLCLKGSLDTVHASGIWGEQNASSGFLDDPVWHWSAEGRGGYDHHHRHPMGRTHIPFHPVPNRRAGLIHLQFVSERRLLAKQFWYQLTERLRWPDKFAAPEIREKYSQTVRAHQKGAGAPCPVNWFTGYGDILHHLHIDAEPWQLAEARHIVAEHPGIAAGLDDFGVLAATTK
jgi:hypothetical protein